MTSLRPMPSRRRAVEFGAASLALLAAAWVWALAINGEWDAQSDLAVRAYYAFLAVGVAVAGAAVVSRREADRHG